MGKNVDRYSNFELLRVVAILMVLVLHYFGMGGGMSNVPAGSMNYYAMHFLESMSIIAVNLFVLITGYFMVGRTKIKVVKAINLIVVAVFYGGVFYLASYLIGESIQLPFNTSEFIHSLNPFVGPKWFVVSYVILFLLSPFINMLLEQLSKKQFQQLLAICMISFSFLPTFFKGLTYNDHGYGVLNFVVLYCLGAYLKKFYENRGSALLYLAIYLVMTAATFGSAVKGIWPSYDYNTVFNLASSVALFLFFSKFQFYSRMVNYLATFTFAIYIIHTDSSIREILFTRLLKTNQYWESKWFLAHLSLSVMAMFVLCIAIEVGRRSLFGLIGRKIKLEKLNRMTIG
jgi:surface polysaccharide O-acyltransferase-like enzyme